MNTPLELGITAAKSGRKKEALEYLHEAIRNNPNDMLALLWIAGLSDEPTQQERYLRRVLQIDPNNQAAQKGLSRLAHLQPPPIPVIPTQNLKPQNLHLQNFNPQPQQQNPTNSTDSDSTGTIAMLIEIVFSLFGLMGVGWVYVSKYLVGTVLFASFFFIFLVEVGFTLASGGVCACTFLPINALLATISGLRLRDYVRRTHAKGSVIYLLFGVFGIILLCIVWTISPLLAGFFNQILSQFTK